MRKILSIVLLVCTVCLLPSCKNQEDNIVVAKINGEEIRMDQIQGDIDFVIGIQKINKKDAKAYNTAVVEVINAYMIDLMCQKEMDALGLTYSTEYYEASKETLVEAYGSEQALLNKLYSLGLGEDYLDKVCRNQANKATLSEYIASKFTVDETDVLQYYIENAESFSVDEIRGMYTLFFATEEEAKTALLDIDVNGFLAYYDLQAVTPTTVAHVRFDTVTKDEFPDALGEVLFSLDLNTYHPEPIKCNLGYALIYVDRIEKNYTFSYEEMKESIETVLLDEATDAALEAYFDNLNQKYVVELLYSAE